MPQGSSRRSPDRLKSNGARLSHLCFLAASSVIDPIQKFDKPLAVDPTGNFLILWIIRGKLLIAATESRPDVYPNLTFD
jgi:hypothetical protein